MSVCIAAISNSRTNGSPYIVTVSDTMVSGGIISADVSVLKTEPIHKEWVAMMAGDDLTQCLPIIEKAKEYFKPTRSNTVQVARSVFKRAFQQHVIEMREDAVLGAYGLSMKEFLKSGKKIFPERKFETLCDRMEQVEPKCEFIVYGFDASEQPHVFQVDRLGSDSVMDKPGFCAIGSGKWAAESVLFGLGQSIDKTMPETIYNVCAAKFTAERSAGVGRYTYLFAKTFGSTYFSHGYGMVDEIRSAWEKHGTPKIPKGIIATIANRGATCS